MELLAASDIVVVNSSTKIIPYIRNGHHCKKNKLKWPTKQVLPKKMVHDFQRHNTGALCTFIA